MKEARLSALAAQVDLDAEERLAEAFGVDASPVVMLVIEGREAATYSGDPTWCARLPDRQSRASSPAGHRAGRCWGRAELQSLSLPCLPPEFRRAMLKWVRRELGHHVATVATPADLAAATEGEEAVMLGYFSKLSGKAHRALTEREWRGAERSRVEESAGCPAREQPSRLPREC